MANQDFGGKITLRTSEGDIISMRGTLTINPADVTIEAVVNQDNSVDRVATPRTPTASFTHVDRGYDYSSLLKRPRENFTFEEEFGDRTFYFTQGFFTGDAEMNRANGEVSGIGIAANKIRRRG